MRSDLRGDARDPRSAPEAFSSEAEMSKAQGEGKVFSKREPKPAEEAVAVEPTPVEEEPAARPQLRRPEPEPPSELVKMVKHDPNTGASEYLMVHPKTMAAHRAVGWFEVKES